MYVHTLSLSVCVIQKAIACDFSSDKNMEKY